VAFFAMPAYPAALRQQGVGGEVTLALTIDERGRVSKADFSRGERRLAEVSIDAIKKWKFNPFILNAEPVGMTGLITLDFQAKTGVVQFGIAAPERAPRAKTPRVKTP
jgi:TonB family protein